MTGSPVPLWYSERLDQPVVVKDVTEKTPLLADGRSVALHFIKRLPRTDPVFRKSLKHGVEVGEDGEVFGLITTYPYCGSDPYRWRTNRINLSDLAGYLDPDGIDDSIVPAEAIKDLRENESRSLDLSCQQPFDLARLGYRIMFGEADELSWIAFHDSGYLLIRLLVRGVFDREDDRLVDPGFLGMTQDHFRVVVCAPRSAQRLTMPGMSVGIDHQICRVSLIRWAPNEESDNDMALIRASPLERKLRRCMVKPLVPAEQ